MLFKKESTLSPILDQSEELHQLDEICYHIDFARESIKELIYHLQKVNYHASLLEELNKKFNV